MNESSTLRTTLEKRLNVPRISIKCHEQLLTEMVSRSKRPFRASLFQESKPGSYKIGESGASWQEGKFAIPNLEELCERENCVLY
ncbi:hypothetical protein OUZ56_011614 [Daphnia magna]|uniref:Uncharacterized protein n=1 Tax=Daphnia magna TaxID=35525 RepID=A0ABQ9Z0U7_9CRUS|nr:hypothetical protein OUZ56_011614 [Daphnia magna]